MPTKMPYGEVRGLYERYRPPNLLSASSNPEARITIVAVGSPDH